MNLRGTDIAAAHSSEGTQPESRSVLLKEAAEPSAGVRSAPRAAWSHNASHLAGDAVRVGLVLDNRYRLKREIARGAGGMVYEAEHLYLKRTVAAKILAPEHRHLDEYRMRLLREAEVLALAWHPNVVQVLDAGEVDEIGPFVIMELLEGRTLEGILTTRQRIGVAESVQLGRQICHALAAAHARGVVHRDVKPSNVFVARAELGREIIKLFDFGVAHTRIAGRKLTQQGAVVGTPEYMSPEQLLAKEDIDGRADLYSVGVLLFECLTGQVPFEGNFGEVLLKVSRDPPPSLRSMNPAVPLELATAIEKALSRSPEDRFPTMEAFAEVLMQIRPVEAARPLLGLRLPGSSAHTLLRPPRLPAGPPPLPAGACTSKRAFALPGPSAPANLVATPGEASSAGPLAVLDPVAIAGASLDAVVSSGPVRLDPLVSGGRPFPFGPGLPSSSVASSGGIVGSGNSAAVSIPGLGANTGAAAKRATPTPSGHAAIARPAPHCAHTESPEQVSRPNPPPPSEFPSDPRRRFPRAPYITPVRIVRPDSKKLDGHSEDISAGGMLVVLSGACEADETVKARFALPMTGRIVELSATAQWVRTARGIEAIGLQFIAVSPDFQTEIEKYVEVMGCG